MKCFFKVENTFVSGGLLLLVVEPRRNVGHVHEHPDRDGKARQRLGHRPILVWNGVQRVVTVKSGIVRYVRRSLLPDKLSPSSPSSATPVWRELVVCGVEDFLGVVGRRLHEVRAGIVSVDQFLRFRELNARRTEVVEAAFDEEAVFFVVVKQVVPELLLKFGKIKFSLISTLLPFLENTIMDLIWIPSLYLEWKWQLLRRSNNNNNNIKSYLAKNLWISDNDDCVLCSGQSHVQSSRIVKKSDTLKRMSQTNNKSKSNI